MTRGGPKGAIRERNRGPIGVRRGIGAALAAAATLAASPAGAVEREHHLGADVGVVVEDSDSPDVGISVGAHWTYGLDDEFNLMAEASWTFVATSSTPAADAPKNRANSIVNADVGIAYVLDVLRWVPYAGVMAGGYGLAGGSVTGAKVFPGVVLAAGLDYRIGRQVAVGVALREHMLVTELTTYPSFTQVLARVEYSWGW